MRCGLFGKLPAKRDFIAPGVPRELLAVFEPWLQASLAASRFALGTRWQAAFLRAPIWRFWLGRDLCGGAVIGALMPSVDGVGRYFPLTLVARAEAGEDLAPPDIDPHETWLDAAEQILLAALSPDADLEQLIGAVDRLGPPRASPAPGTGGVAPLAPTGWSTAAAGAPEALRGAVARLVRADRARATAGTSLWWTLGGDGFAPRALIVPGLPAADIFAAFLTGDFPAAPDRIAGGAASLQGLSEEEQ